MNFGPVLACTAPSQCVTCIIKGTAFDTLGHLVVWVLPVIDQRASYFELALGNEHGIASCLDMSIYRYGASH